MKNYQVSSDKARLDISLIYDYLSNSSYWAKGCSRSTVEKSIENSLCFGVYDGNGVQVGFSRVVTDFSTFAWIMDLFILPDYRGLGLSKMLPGGCWNTQVDCWSRKSAFSDEARRRKIPGCNWLRIKEVRNNENGLCFLNKNYSVRKSARVGYLNGLQEKNVKLSWFWSTQTHRTQHQRCSKSV